MYVIHKHDVVYTYMYVLEFGNKNTLSPVKTSMYFSTPFPKTPLERAVYYFQSGFRLVRCTPFGGSGGRPP